MTENKELVIFQQIQPLQIFQDNKADDFLNGVKKEVEEFKKTRDISTPKGRAEIKSFAFKIAQTKAPLDKAGLSLTEEMRDKVKLINAERSRIKEALEAYQNDVRQPLTDFENAEKKRIAELELRIARIQSFKELTSDYAEIEVTAAIKDVEFLKDYHWQEFAEKSKNLSLETLEHLNNTLAKIKKHITEKEELEKLRKEKEERELKEREAQIAREATQKAERIAREEAERKAKFVEDEKYRLEAEKKALELAKIEAEKKVQQEILEAQKRIEEARIQARRDREEAIKIERARVEEQRVKEEKEAKLRAQNLAHKTKIYNEMIKALSQFDTKQEKGCKALIKAIADGNINNIQINY